MRPEWNSYAEWTRALVRASAGGAADDRLERLSEDGMDILSAITGGELWAGGALVPESMLPELRVDPLTPRPLRSLCTPWRMTSGSQRFPYAFSDDHSSDAPYGMQYRWEPDDDTDVLDESTPTFAAARARAKLLEAYMPVEYPLIEDAAEAFESAISRVAQVVYNWVLDQAIIRGSGAGQPRGIIDAPGTITVDRSTADEIGSVDLATAEARLLPACSERALWLMHPAARSQVRQRGESALRVGGATGLTLDGRRAIVTEHCSALGVAGDLILADLGAYQLYDRQAVMVDLSSLAPEAFGRWRTLVRVTARLDGQPGLSEPITPAEGTDKLSAFVVLGTA